MYKHEDNPPPQDDDEDENASAAALIDSYFLPGGILDTEDVPPLFLGRDLPSSTPNGSIGTHSSARLVQPGVPTNTNTSHHAPRTSLISRLDDLGGGGRGGVVESSRSGVQALLSEDEEHSPQIGGSTIVSPPPPLPPSSESSHQGVPNGFGFLNPSDAAAPLSSTLAFSSSSGLGAAATRGGTNGEFSRDRQALFSSGWLSSSTTAVQPQAPSSSIFSSTFHSSNATSAVDQEYSSSLFPTISQQPSASSSVVGAPTHSQQQQQSQQGGALSGGSSSQDDRTRIRTGTTSTRSQNPWGNEPDLSSSSPKLVLSTNANPHPTPNHTNHNSSRLTAQYANVVRNSMGNPRPSGPHPTSSTPPSTSVHNFPGVPSSTATTDTTRSTATTSHRQTNKGASSSSFRPPPGFSTAREESNPRSTTTMHQHRPGPSQFKHSVNNHVHSMDPPASTNARNDSSHVYPLHSNHGVGGGAGPLATPPMENSQAMASSRQRPQPEPSDLHHHAPPDSSNMRHLHPPQAQTQSNHHPQDGDYDMLSVTSKSSRGVPSTIYVHQDEDAVSNSEDTLTVCADSSVTDASLVAHTGSKNERGGVKSSDNERMDVVEETSAIEVRVIQKEEKVSRFYQGQLRFFQILQRSVQTPWERNAIVA